MIGQSVARDEDGPLLRGRGRYTEDGAQPGDLVLEFLRAPVAAAAIRRLDLAAARAMPGVRAVVTQRELAEARLGEIAPRVRLPAPGGGEMPVPPFPMLADGAVRHVGEPVAAVVAESRGAALDALEAIEVDYDERPSVTDPLVAAGPDAPRVWEELPNHCFRFERGDADAVARAVGRAARLVRRRLRISRVTAVSLEPRNVRASWDGHRYTLELGSQAPHRIAEGLAELMGVAADRVHVIGRDCGGGFGMKNSPYREYAVALWATQALGRPVRWHASRSEAFQSDDHARDQWVEATLALDAEGRFLALAVETHAALGAYLGPATPLPPTANVGGLTGVYRIPAMHVAVNGMFTNTQTTSPYRGAGRPEATYVVERMIDIAARETGIDRVDLRRRNMIRPEHMPYESALTFTYDCGDFPGVMAQALELGDWEGAEARRRASAERGRLRGVGLCNAIEIAGGPLPAPTPEFADLRLRPDGGGWLGLGSSDTGQGHATTFRQLLADRLGLFPEGIEIESGDTDRVRKGTGTFGSRTAIAAGTALWRAMDVVIDRLRARAAERLEVAVADLTFDRGSYAVAGTDRTIPFREVLAAEPEGVAASEWLAADAPTFPNGCHVCEVEIDPETGEVRLDRYAVVDDVGTVLNPMLVEGQIVGGAVQSVGQALMERIAFDPGSGQLLTASFMDYAMPRATDVPAFAVGEHPVPTALNPLGVKGVGESGTVGALAAVMSAVADALAPLGIDHIDMPATPDRVWSAIRSARGA